ncbi:Gp37 protein [Pseudogulbenkiania sp. NH8B]|uniref:Gp37 family protein n=1 Tax=Pseudogulbenkiania sp. (strain NH8B) TaxID=748280 RepID=UPI00022794FC|nr:Gp37 family protein [Pseudogulbenkiania sp. NH8B]BAK75388.1 Gp37 protein [Pseudogulbenkiania sp. NH8B]
MLSQTEDSLIQRLQAYLPADIEVMGLPDTPQELVRHFDVGQVFVYFAGLTGKPAPSTSGSGESRLQVWQLLVRHRSKRKNGGLYALIDSCRLLLSGFMPAGCAGRMQLQEESAPEVLDNVWVAFVTFTVPAPNVPLADPDAGPRLVRATWENLPHDHVTVVENTQ